MVAVPQRSSRERSGVKYLYRLRDDEVVSCDTLNVVS